MAVRIPSRLGSSMTKPIEGILSCRITLVWSYPYLGKTSAAKVVLAVPYLASLWAFMM
jgi:hypothetical protein